MTTTTQISQRTIGYIAKKLLERAQPLLILDRFGQAKPIPKHHTRTIKFRGYNHLANQPKPLMEGITPASSQPTFRDIEATLGQYGDWVELTDVLADTHEDPLIAEFTDILGSQAAVMRERITLGVLLAGTNVYFSGVTAGVPATARTGVNEPITLNLQRRILRGLKRQLATPHTSFVSASPNFSTSPIPPSFIAICHTDCEADIRNIPGFVPTEKYGSYSPLPGEIGSVEGVRYLATTVAEAWPDAGDATTTMVSTTGACADVYPVLYLGKSAYGIVPFASSGKGSRPVTPAVLNPNIPRGGDPLGQRGSIGWKMMHTAIILYDFWMARAEVAVSIV
ncbi:MAG: N4-gp56 family major capsid protein [Desulfovibrio sp.]|jgi:N4-gp56 family major capsid protein|nr:N4-gp56 family major capsid protein [Desulfovibrio sp.]